MSVGQRVGNLGDDPGCFLPTHGAIDHPFVEILPVEEFGNDQAFSVLSIDVEHRHDAGMLELRQSPGFLKEFVDQLRGGSITGAAAGSRRGHMRHFDRDITVELPIVSAIHRSESPLPIIPMTSYLPSDSTRTAVALVASPVAVSSSSDLRIVSPKRLIETLDSDPPGKSIVISSARLA